MAKIPVKPGDIFTEIIDDFRNVFGNELLSIILYGSGARGDYIPGKSDINFLVILTEAGIGKLANVIGTVTLWRKRHVAIPLFMTRDYVLSSVDAYPVEFLNMKRHYTLVFGEDVLAPLSFKPADLRLQLERELKAKILHLRTGYLETEGREKQIRQLIKVSINAFIALFNALLTLKKMAIPDSVRTVIQATARDFGVEAAVFLQCVEVRNATDHLNAAGIQILFQDYLIEVNKLCYIVDHLEIE